MTEEIMFSCHKTKAVNIAVCANCFGIFHNSCLERDHPKVKRLGGHLVDCCGKKNGDVNKDEELNKLFMDNRKLKEELQRRALGEKENQLDETIEQLTEENSDLKEVILQLNKDNETLKELVEKEIDESHKVLMEENINLKNVNADLEDEIAAMKSKLKENEKKMNRLQEEYIDVEKSLMGRLGESSNRNTILMREIQEYKSTINRRVCMEEELNAVTENLNELVQRESSLKKSLHDMEKEKKDIEGVTLVLERKLDESEGQVKRMKIQEQNLSTVVNKLTEENKLYWNEMERLRKDRILEDKKVVNSGSKKGNSENKENLTEELVNNMETNLYSRLFRELKKDILMEITKNTSDIVKGQEVESDGKSDSISSQSDITDNEVGCLDGVNTKHKNVETTNSKSPLQKHHSLEINADVAENKTHQKEKKSDENSTFNKVDTIENTEVEIPNSSKKTYAQTLKGKDKKFSKNNVTKTQEQQKHKIPNKLCVTEEQYRTGETRDGNNHEATKTTVDEKQGDTKSTTSKHTPKGGMKTNITIGRNKNPLNNEFEGVKRKLWLYIYRVKKTSTEDRVHGYILDKRRLDQLQVSPPLIVAETFSGHMVYSR